MVYVSTKKVIAFILSIVLLAFVGCKSAGKKKAERRKIRWKLCISWESLK
jgi:hypothetical protein